jgi:transcriptional regulator with XRE-family HTH domain
MTDIENEWLLESRFVYVDGGFAKCLARNLRYIREKLNLTQVQFARKLGIQQGTLSRLESGNQNISLHVLEQICTRLKMTPNELLLMIPPTEYAESLRRS